MDSMSYRNNRSAQRQVEPEQAATPPVQPVGPAPAPASSRTKHSTPKAPKKSKKPLMLAAVILAVLIVAIIGWNVLKGGNTGSAAIDGSKYQAIFLSNGQVYFGKLRNFDSEYMKLNDVYYLQTQSTEGADSENPQQTSSDQGDVQLIKLGDEIHGPQDEMIVSKDQMLFYENLKSDGKVAQSIAQFKKP